MTADEKRRLTSERVTLNGNPASISGASLPFAHVTDRITGLSCEWSWETVARIVRNGGRFVS